MILELVLGHGKGYRYRPSVVVRPSESKMTMTSSAVPGVGLVCPEVADEANPGAAPSPTSWAHVNWGGLLVACSSSLVLLPFLFCCVSLCLRLHGLRYE